MAKRFDRIAGQTWANMEIRKEALSKNFKKRSGRVMFPSTHDIFDFSPFKEACFIVLEKLLKSGNSVLITTKPRFVVIQEISQQFEPYKEQIQFRFTITSSSDRLLEFWEPNAPRFKERIASLKYAFQKRFKTSVSIEPFLDYDPKELVKIIEPFVTESIWIGKMNYIPRKNISEKDKPYYNEIRQNYEYNHLLEIHNRLGRNPKIRIKDSIRIRLRQFSPSIENLTTIKV